MTSLGDLLLELVTFPFWGIVVFSVVCITVGYVKGLMVGKRVAIENLPTADFYEPIVFDYDEDDFEIDGMLREYFKSVEVPLK